jgi:hypothetical protein
MNQTERSWKPDPDDAATEQPDPWFRPVWDDLIDETEIAPLPRLAARPPATRFSPDGNLPGALAAAHDALARLDAMAEIVPPDIQAGLITRLSYAEAAGLIAARGGVVHPLDLALRDAERLGRQDLLARGQAAGAMDDLEMDEAAAGALHLARLLRGLPAAHDPLATAESARSRLGPLASGSAAAFDAGRFDAWRAAHWPDGRRAERKPVLLRAADATAAWMESGIADVPNAATALAVSAMLARRAGLLRTIPLPVWAGWRGLCAPGDPGQLPRLRGDAAARLTGTDEASWPVVFLHMTAEAARAGSRILAALRRAGESGADLAAGQNRQSRLPGAIGLLLRQPALTAASLAAHLGITPQAALRILLHLVAAGVVSEVTGRKSYRAFGILWS